MRSAAAEITAERLLDLGHGGLRRLVSRAAACMIMPLMHNRIARPVLDEGRLQFVGFFWRAQTFERCDLIDAETASAAHA
jgi:hypothetical protein